MYVTHQLVLRHGLDYRNIERAEVTVMTKMLTYPGLAFAGPYENIDQAIASKPFAIAAILRNASFTSDVYKSQLRSQETLDLARRVKVSGADEWDDEWRCLVRILMKDGSSFSGDERMVDRSIFYPNRQQIIGKFRAMVEATPFGATSDRIAELVFALDDLTDLRTLTSAISQKAR